jgi:dimethylglycine dehydrogenase
MEHLESVYAALWQAGAAHGMANFGVYAVNSMRMEKAYPAWSSELTNEITLIEAGLERFVNYQKGDFVGREALLKRKEDGIKIKMIYLEVAAHDADCRGGEPVYHKGSVVGMTTSGAFGHRTGKSLAFAYVQAELEETDYEIMLLGELRGARVLNKAAYDPMNERLRS